MQKTPSNIWQVKEICKEVDVRDFMRRIFLLKRSIVAPGDKGVFTFSHKNITSVGNFC